RRGGRTPNRPGGRSKRMNVPLSVRCSGECRRIPDLLTATLQSPMAGEGSSPERPHDLHAFGACLLLGVPVRGHANKGRTYAGHGRGGFQKKQPKRGLVKSYKKRRARRPPATEKRESRHPPAKFPADKNRAGVTTRFTCPSRTPR